jgi:hypothetical protein
MATPIFVLLKFFNRMSTPRAAKSGAEATAVQTLARLLNAL